MSVSDVTGLSLSSAGNAEESNCLRSNLFRF